MSDSRITQSMCRTMTPEGQEQSACVACQSPCFDIDSERTYWDGIHAPQESLMRYGYLGLVVGYFVYYYLYAGNWDYYFSGVWNRDPNQLASLMSPGLYLFGQPIGIPKLVAVPLVLGGFTLAGIGLGRWLTARAKVRALQRNPNVSTDLIQHRFFAITTFIAFNFFFFFAGRPLLRLTPLWMQFLFDGIILFASTLWLQQSWGRSPARYSRENLAGRLRKQLTRLNLDTSRFLEGRSLEELSADEVYVLAKVLPDFTQEKRHQAYKGVVRDALAEGYATTANSLDVLQQMRRELDISENEHRQVLEELGVEDPDLLSPDRQRSLENQIRLSGYQRSLERLLRLQSQPNLTSFEPSPQETETLRSLRSEYAITAQEEDWVLQDLEVEELPKAEGLLARLSQWVDCDRALTHPTLQNHEPVVAVVRDAVARKQDLLVRSLLDTLPDLPDHPDTAALVQALHQLSPPALETFLNQAAYREQLPPTMVKTLTQPVLDHPTPPSAQAAIDHLENLLTHYNPLVAAASLYLLAQLDSQRATMQAEKRRQGDYPQLVQDTAAAALMAENHPPLTAFPTLEKLVYLHNSDFFHRLDPNTLIALAHQAEVRTHTPGEAITEAGDTCRELLILMAGEASIHYQQPEGTRVEQFHPGQTLDELEVLAYRDLENTILADSDPTRILAIPVDAFDALLDKDPDFARRVLALESQRLQTLMNTASSPAQ
jgi:CRP-like cAMP-binding protein